MSGRRYVALVLHGHLPAVALHEEAPRDRLAERWLFEAIWECYLPLVALLDRLERDGVVAPWTLSISPTLASMLRAPELYGRMQEHLTALSEVNDGIARSPFGTEAASAACRFYAERFAKAQAHWQAIEGDLLGAFHRHAREGRIELMTTSASHAYLPGLVTSTGAVAAQLEIGLRAFAALCGQRPRGFWLPECAFVPALDAPLGRCEVRFSVLDGHGLANAQPCPPTAWWRPVAGPSGVAYFGRDRAASHQVWSRRIGYPGDPAYREFHRDVGYELRPEDLGPLGVSLDASVRLPTGLKYWRITGPTDSKRPYEPALARERAQEHARHFVERLAGRLGKVAEVVDHPVSVAAYDAELFGHWWLEGPQFFEQVLRRLAAHRELEPTTLDAYLEAHPCETTVRPAASSWGEGGFGQVWVGPRTAFLWRHVHATHRRVREAVARCPDPTGARFVALDQAVRQSLLLQSSDWAFMLHGGELAAYAQQRLQRHHATAARFSRIALAHKLGAVDVRFVEQAAGRRTFLRELDGEALLDAFCR